MVCFRGNVVTLECVENIIKKDMVDPTNGKKLKERDIILLQRVSSHGSLGKYMQHFNTSQDQYSLEI